MAEPILKRIANGDSAAVAECLDQYGGLVWSLARRMLGSAEDAEDVVQEIFVELWQKADRFEPQRGAEATFIVMVARRRIIDRQRRAGRALVAAALPEDGQADAPQPCFAEIYEEAAVAKACLAELKPDERRVLELSIYHGLPQATIADNTGLPLGTVKTHARRGLIRLRELMQKRSASFQRGGVS